VSDRMPRPGSRIARALIEAAAIAFLDRIAGTAATPTVTAPVRNRQAASTVVSTRASDKRTTVAGLAAINQRSAADAIATPMTPPATANRPASARLYFSNCHVVAPSARRTASSRERRAFNASRSPATFAHAMTRTKPTAPRSSHNACRAVPKMCWMSGLTVTRPVVSRFIASRVASACACAAGTSGRNRART